MTDEPISGTYQTVTIKECNEPLVAIPMASFCLTEPHPYVALAAPYGDASPWYLRQGVLDALHRAQAELGRQRPGWRLKLFDAYRPLAVQAFMVWREFHRQAERTGCSLAPYRDAAELQACAPGTYVELAATVFEFWGRPSKDPLTPPPHSTGAAIDLTLSDASGNEIDMGSPIDETSPRSYPEHYARATDPRQQAFHGHRQLLNQVMVAAGFCRHRNEWWHFSLGDQMWAWTLGMPVARYGRAR